MPKSDYASEVCQYHEYYQALKVNSSSIDRWGKTVDPDVATHLFTNFLFGTMSGRLAVKELPSSPQISSVL